MKQIRQRDLARALHRNSATDSVVAFPSIVSVRFVEVGAGACICSGIEPGSRVCAADHKGLIVTAHEINIQVMEAAALFTFQPTPPPSYTQDMSIVRDAAAIAKGMSITLKEVFQPTQVENYPDGKGPMRGAKFQERFRGKHQLQRDENGLEKCVACFLCAAACPSNCIYIEAAENTEEKRISSAERYAKVYNIDYNRCIFCGYCVEACPTDAITHGHGFELASLNATTLVMRKEDLLVPTPQLPDDVRSDKDQAEILA
jgi:NADH-quinone oxidoreductase subunit I